MYGGLLLLENTRQPETARRVFLGEIPGKNEKWLRDMIFDHPEIIPIESLDPAFGPLIPLCKELRTDAGFVDAVFINGHGRLTLLECKLWKNPQARREVVAQALDYVSSISGWAYADLQRQVSSALGSKGNVPFEVVKKSLGPEIEEQKFVDAAARALRDGRIMIVIAGDGIREGVQSLTELVNRNSTRAFSFGIVDVAVYQFPNERLVIQPRVLVQTETIERRLTVLDLNGVAARLQEPQDEEPPAEINEALPISGDKRARLEPWWQPILQMKFDDPEQEPPFWVGTNNAVLDSPFPGVQIKSFAMVNKPATGVFMSGRRRNDIDQIRKYLIRDKEQLLEQLPDMTIINTDQAWPIMTERADIKDDNERRGWLIETLNTYVNVLRPYLRSWRKEAML